MLTLYHAPRSRSTRIVQLLEELGARDRVDLRIVSIPRQDGSGGQDEKNPHPEGKVPLLDHDGTQIWESNAILMYLCELFPEAGLAPAPGAPDRGAYLSWMTWYGNVVEPVIVISASGVKHPMFEVTFRGAAQVADRLARALQGREWLLGERYSAADLLLASPFLWFPDATPDSQIVRDWVARCGSRPSALAAAAFDEAAMGA